MFCGNYNQNSYDFQKHLKEFTLSDNKFDGTSALPDSVSGHLSVCIGVISELFVF